MYSIVAGGMCFFCLLQIGATLYPWDQTTGKEDSLKVEATGSMKNILPNENFHIMQNIILEQIYGTRPREEWGDFESMSSSNDDFHCHSAGWGTVFKPFYFFEIQMLMIMKMGLLDMSVMLRTEFRSLFVILVMIVGMVLTKEGSLDKMLVTKMEKVKCW